jgi:hypothetical protein
MKKSSLAFIMAGAFACTANAAVTPVALGAAVTLNGAFGGEQGAWGSHPQAGGYHIEYRQDGHWLTVRKAPAADAWRLDNRYATLAAVATMVGGRYYAEPKLQEFTPVPEPQEWSMMLIGVGLVGFQVRRKQQRLARTGCFLANP